MHHFGASSWFSIQIKSVYRCPIILKSHHFQNKVAIWFDNCRRSSGFHMHPGIASDPVTVNCCDLKLDQTTSSTRALDMPVFVHQGLVYKTSCQVTWLWKAFSFQVKSKAPLVQSSMCFHILQSAHDPVLARSQLQRDRAR